MAANEVEIFCEISGAAALNWTGKSFFIRDRRSFRAAASLFELFFHFGD